MIPPKGRGGHLVTDARAFPGAPRHPCSMDDHGDPYLREAQVQVDRLIQNRTRLFAFGLIGLDLIYGFGHGEWLGLHSHWVPMALMASSFGGLLTLVIWLRKPRPMGLVNALGGVATLLAVLGTLSHLHQEVRLWETTHLMLVAVGAGCFIYSLPWVGLNLAVALGGWITYAILHRPPQWPYFGVDLLGAALLGLLLYFVRRDQMLMFRELLARDAHRADQQQHTLNALKEALEGIKTLRGLVPICSSCKKIRDDRGYWHQVETYVHAHTEASFTHGLCPHCAEVLRAEFEAVTKEPSLPA